MAGSCSTADVGATSSVPQVPSPQTGPHRIPSSSTKLLWQFLLHCFERVLQDKWTFFSSVTEHLNKTFPRARGETPDGQPGNGNDQSSADSHSAGTRAQVSGQSLVTKNLSFVLPEQLPDGVLPTRAAPCLPLLWATKKFPAAAAPIPGWCPSPGRSQGGWEEDDWSFLHHLSFLLF